MCLSGRDGTDSKGVGSLQLMCLINRPLRIGHCCAYEIFSLPSLLRTYNSVSELEDNQALEPLFGS